MPETLLDRRTDGRADREPPQRRAAHAARSSGWKQSKPDVPISALGGKAEYPLHRRADVTDDPLPIEDRDDVGSIFDQSSKPLRTRLRLSVAAAFHRPRPLTAPPRRWRRFHPPPARALGRNARLPRPAATPAMRRSGSTSKAGRPCRRKAAPTCRIWPCGSSTRNRTAASGITSIYKGNQCAENRF